MTCASIAVGPLEQARVGGGAPQRAVRRLLQQPHRVLAREREPLGVDRLEQLRAAGQPGPAVVVGESRQRRERIRAAARRVPPPRAGCPRGRRSSSPGRSSRPPIIRQALLSRVLTDPAPVRADLPLGRARVRRLDHQRRRRAAVGRRAAVLGAVGRARPGPAVHELRGRRRAGRRRRRAPDPGVRAVDRARPARALRRSAACTSASTTCARRTGTPVAFRVWTSHARCSFLTGRCERVLTVTAPLDLGRPRAVGRCRS